MSSSGKDFLDRMLEEGEKHSAKPTNSIIAKMMISVGYSGYVKGHRTDTIFQPFNDPDDGKKIAAAVSSVIAANGGKSKAVLGLLVSVPKDTVLSFESEWDKTRFIDRYGDEDDFMAILDAANELDFPIGEWFWCKYESPESLSAIAKGEKGKYEKKKDGVPTGEFVFPRIMLPVEKFADEADARNAAGDNGSAAASSTKWSDTARANYPDVNNIETSANEILDWLEKAKKGIAFANDAENYPLPLPATPPNLKKYIADLYNIDASDIDLLIPF